jgi:VIT1/CCC1 family predicted Fe2+/Mn2+ transporter
MKAISASIVILAAAVLIAVGSHVSHNDTKLFVQVVGCGLGLAGLFVWYLGLQEK